MRQCISLLRRFPVPLHRLGKVFCYSYTILIANAEVTLRQCMSLLGRFPVPLRRLGKVFCHAPTKLIANAQIVLRFHIALFCRLAVAFKRLLQIFCDTYAITIAVAQFFLCLRIALHCRLAVQFCGFCLVLADAVAGLIAHTQLILCFRAFLLCGLFVPHDRIFFVFFHTRAVLVTPCHFQLCIWASVFTSRNHVLLKRHLGIADLLKITGILQIVLLGFLLRFLLRFLTQTKALHEAHEFSLFILRPIELKAVHGIFLIAETHSLDFSPQTIPIHTASRRFKPFFNRFCLDGIRDFHLLPTHTDRLQFIRKTYFHLNFAHNDSLPMYL